MHTALNSSLQHQIKSQSAVLCCTILYSTVLYGIVLLYSKVLCTTVSFCPPCLALCTALHCAVPFSHKPYCATLYRMIVLHGVICCAIYFYASMRCTALHCMKLSVRSYCTVLFGTSRFQALRSSALYCTVLYCTVLYCTVLH